MSKIISCERCGGGWRIETITPSGARCVGIWYGSRAQVLEQASHNTAEPEPA